MLIVKKVTKQSDGNFSSEWNVSASQMSFLLTYAINNLMAAGLVDIKEVEEPYENQQQLDFLVNTDAGSVQ